MRKSAVLSFVLLTSACSQEGTSQQKDLGPRSQDYVVTSTYGKSYSLSQRLSLIMNPNDIQFYKVSGTSVLDMYALAVSGKTFKKFGYEHINGNDFVAVRAVEVSSRIFDLNLYSTGEKIGRLESDGYSWKLSELCTGETEALCTFRWENDSKTFDFSFQAPVDSSSSSLEE